MYNTHKGTLLKYIESKNMDKIFIAEMLKKYSKHLSSVVVNIDYLISDYDRQIESLSKLEKSKYGYRIKELENKRTEAFIKLSHVLPNIENMQIQINLLEI
jgi:hypothetical protein